ncbi:response regulator transcription factor [Halocola ammonii]
MKKEEIDKMVSIWKKGMTNKLDKSKPLENLSDLNRMASLFATGNFYYFIFNWYTIEMEYVDPNIKNILGIEPEDWSEVKYLEMQTEESLAQTQMKEAAVGRYCSEIIPSKDLPYYKSSYFVTMVTPEGKKKRILHQSNTLTLSDNGTTERVFCVHTDLSHMKILKDETVSMLGMNGRPSYYNIGAENQAEKSDELAILKLDSNEFSDRELEIIERLSKGETAKEIAERLEVKENTVRTHRQRILEKSGCRNTAELVTKCLVQGLI